MDRRVPVASKNAEGLITPLQQYDAIYSDTPEGAMVLLRSAVIVVAEATFQVLKKAMVLQHGGALENTSLCSGYFADVPGEKMTEDILQQIRARAETTIQDQVRFERHTVPHALLLQRLQHQGNKLTLSLIEALNYDEYECIIINGWYSLALDHITSPDTSMYGFGKELKLELSSANGLWIRFESMPKRDHLPGLNRCFRLAEQWGELARTRCVGDVNKIIVEPQGPKLWVESEEERFTMMVNDCAKKVQSGESEIKLVLISGPSAAGKTTFSHRLANALRALGRSPTVLSTDDYYRSSSEPDYPKTKDGKPNHEVVECMRLKDFWNDVQALFNGETVETPIFDMKLSKPKEEGRSATLPPHGILIMEGIFAIHPKMTEGLPKGTSFKIFIVPLSQVNVDDLTFISNQQIRQIRRIARDFRGRGRNAAESLARSVTVRLGEEQSIFPNIVHADYVFNSTMSHELSVLQTHCYALLREVQPGDPNYFDAQRILTRLEMVSSVAESHVPPESLLREFIGGSVFEEEEERKQASEKDGASRELKKNPSLICPKGYPNYAVPNVKAAKSFNPPLCTVRDALAEAEGTDDKVSSPLAPFGAEETRKEKESPPREDAIGALVDSELTDLLDEWPRCRGPSRVDPVFARSRLGFQLQRATLSFLMHVAVKRIYPELTAVVLHGFGLEGSMEASSYYVEMYANVDDTQNPTEVTPDMIKAISAGIQRLVDSKTPIEHLELVHFDARQQLYRQGQRFAARLLNTCTVPTVKMHVCDGIYSLALQPLAPHAGHVRLFAIRPTADLPGFALCFPTVHAPDEARPPALHARVMAEIQARRRRVAFSHEVGCIADLNRQISHGEGQNHIRLAAAIDTMQCADVASRVRRERIKVVFIAGASSSGKSVFATQLFRHLQALGVYCSRLTTDAYYRNLVDPDYPRTPRGEGADCEHVEALQLDEFAAGITDLVAGKSIEEPVFDLGQGRRVTDSNGRHVEGLPTDDDSEGVLIVEGLFALAPEIRSRLDSSIKSLTVMISPLTVVNLDEQRFVSAQVLRILRRIVRDSEERGRDATTTIARWDSVTRGEARHAVPQLFEADVVISASSLVELHQLAPRATALLLQVSPSTPKEFFEARQLLNLLKWVHHCA
jgi:uridine kinase